MNPILVSAIRAAHEDEIEKARGLFPKGGSRRVLENIDHDMARQSKVMDATDAYVRPKFGSEAAVNAKRGKKFDAAWTRAKRLKALRLNLLDRNVRQGRGDWT